jgi:uncharacterized protein YbjT (DUF2867 family)
MKIVVIGGTGLVGAKLVRQLGEAGHETVVAARSTGVDTVTGTGLAEAIAGAEAVVDVSNPGYADPEAMLRFFEASGANLFAAEHRAGTRHHIAFSAIGTGRIDTGYYRAKDAQEDLVAASGIPFTIVRSTPLFEYIYAIVDAASDQQVVRVPPVRMRPIAADDVARVLARVALGRPENAIVEVAGPDVYPLSTLAENILVANEDSRSIVVDPDATFFGARIGDEPLTGGANPRQGDMGFEDWLRRSLIPA